MLDDVDELSDVVSFEPPSEWTPPDAESHRHLRQMEQERMRQQQLQQHQRQMKQQQKQQLQQKERLEGKQHQQQQQQYRDIEIGEEGAVPTDVSHFKVDILEKKDHFLVHAELPGQANRRDGRVKVEVH